MKLKNFVLSILFLIALDQTIIIIINAYFLDARFYILYPILEFWPYWNTKYSGVNDWLYWKWNIDLGIWLHLILNLLFLLVMTILYSFFRNIRNVLRSTKLLDISFILGISGMICLFISNYFWKNGCLDYIGLIPLFVFDLKDFYLFCFSILFFLFFLKNKTIIEPLDRKITEQLKNRIRFLKPRNNKDASI